MSLYDEIVGSTEEKKKKKQNSSTQTTSSSSLYDDIISGNYTIPSKAETSLYMGNKKKQQTQEEKAKQQAQEYVKNLADTWANKQKKKSVFDTIGSYAGAAYDYAKDKSNQLMHYTESGKAMKDFRNFVGNTFNTVKDAPGKAWNAYIDWAAMGGPEKAYNDLKRTKAITEARLLELKTGLKTGSPELVKDAALTGQEGTTLFDMYGLPAMNVPNIAFKTVLGTGVDTLKGIYNEGAVISEEARERMGAITPEERQQERAARQSFMKEDTTGKIYKDVLKWDDDVYNYVDRNSAVTENNAYGRIIQGLTYSLEMAAAGNAWKPLTFLSASGASQQREYRKGASDLQAIGIGTFDGLTEMFAEEMFSGEFKLPGAGKNAIGMSVEQFEDKLTNKITNNVVRWATQHGFNIANEQLEEIAGGVAGNIAQKIFYMSEPEKQELYSSKEMQEDLVYTAITTFLSGGARISTNGGINQVKQDIQSGRSQITGLTPQEQRQINEEKQLEIRKQEKQKEEQELLKKQEQMTPEEKMRYGLSQQAIPKMKEIWQSRQIQQQLANMEALNAPVINETQQGNINTLQEQNIAQNANNEVIKNEIQNQSEAFNLGKNENVETQTKPKGKAMSLQEISDRLGVKNNNIEKTTQQEYNKVTEEEGVENEFRRLQEESRNLSNEEQQAYRNGSKEIDEKLRGRLSRVLGERVESSRSSNSNDARVLKDNKSGNSFEVYDNVDGQTFRDAFEIARTYTKNSELVDLHPVETTEDATGYNDTYNYITKDGLSGYAITKDGDLISVFNANDKRGWLRAIKPDIEAKAKTLDCYMSPNQPLSEMYEKIFGFKTAAVMDYNMEYDHDDIAKNHNMPQVAFMVKTDQDIETKHFNKDQYNEALEYRNSLVDNQGTSDSSFSNEQNDISDEEFENNQPEILDKMPVTKGDSIDSVRSGIKWFRKELVDRFAPIYDLSRKYNNKTLYHKADKISASDGAAQVDLGRNQVNNYGKPYTNFTDENGNKVSMSWETVYDSFDNIPVKAKNTYLVNQLNLDRLKQNVNQFNISEKQSVKTIENLRNEYKDIDKWAENVYQYYRNLQEKMVENGRISSQQVNEWNKNNPHYVYIQRNVKGKSNKSVGFKNNNISSDNLIRRVKGGSYDILPIKVSTGDFTRNVSRALAYNDFAREYYNTIGKDSYNNSTQNMTVTDPYVEFAKENGNTVGINSEKIPIDEIFGVEPKILNDDGSGNYTIKVYENGKTIEVPISKEVFNSLGPQNIPRVGLLAKATNAYKEVLTNKNPFFGFYRNPIKDVQDMFLYSKFPLYKSLGTYGKLFKGRTPLGGKFIDKANNVTAQDVVNFYYNTGNAANSVLKNGQFTSEVQKEKGKIRKTLSKGGDAIERGNEFFESMPRITEFWNTIDSNNYTLKDGELVPKPGTTPKKSINQVISEASYNAADVTVNFKRGGRTAKAISQNGGIFFNPGVQGASKFVRNVTESIDDARNGDFTPAKRLVARAALMGIAPALLGKIMYGDDDEYDDMQDYQKDRFYLIKAGNGNWIKIPKGRAISIIQSATRRTVAKMEGEEDPFKDYWSFVENQIAPNSPLDNNILSPISGAITNKSWTGKQIVSDQLLEEKVEDQYDENTDEFSKWLGKKLKISPKRINYVLDQYSGVIGDMFLPQITNSAKTKTNIPGLNIIEKDLTINSAYSNKSTNNFYDAFNKLDKNKDNTIEDNAKKNYLNDRKKELKELRQQKKDIQNDNTLSHKEKYEQSLEIQKKINELSKQSLKDIENFDDHTYYATIGDATYYLTTDDNGKDVWKKDGYAEKNKQKASYEDMSLYEFYKNKYDEKKNKEKKTEKETETKEEKRYKELESKGIDRKTFYKFKDFVNSTKGDSKKGGLSKKEKVINYIQGLNHLTAKEKQALYEDYQQNSRVYQTYN